MLQSIVTLNTKWNINIVSFFVLFVKLMQRYLYHHNNNIQDIQEDILSFQDESLILFQGVMIE
jgi:hypothetical protein